MGVSWAGRGLLLLGSRSVIQILLSGRLPKAGHDVPDGKAVARASRAEQHEFPRLPLQAPELLAISARGR